MRTLLCFASFLVAAPLLAQQEQEAPQPLPPEQAARTMVVPEGFQVSLFAGEPDVKQPIAFCMNDRGRLWVCEAYNYPDRNAKEKQDRVLILEDTDSDGKFDKRTVFYDKLRYVTGIEVGFGGVWIMSPPLFQFIPDRDGDDRPDGEPEVLLDGIGSTYSNHNIASGFAWGPDGWLYAGHGRTSPSEVGKPGTPDDQRIHFDGGVYRYHPTRHVFEAFADGTTNPWGVDFDDYGSCFVSNCVTPHLYHMIQGGHYEPWRGRPSSRFAYERLPSCADHLHWQGSNAGAAVKLPGQMELGGGHAHCGTMVYLGDNWPDAYRNTTFMCNVHGKRINNDPLQRKGSSYVATHGRDLMISKDPWFMGVTLLYGPDGGVFVSDWSDTGECHSYVNTRRETGRIFKITYGRPAPVKVDIAALSNDELVKLQLHKNDWYVRHARRVLQERAAAGQDLAAVHQQLAALLESNPDVTRQLRQLWALHATGGTDEALLTRLLEHDSEYLRAWGIRLLSEGEVSPTALRKFAALSVAEESPFVRLRLAGALQRLPLDDRWEIAAGLVSAADAEDDYLPLVTWYGLEPLVKANLPRTLQLVPQCQIPQLREFIARRAAE